MAILKRIDAIEFRALSTADEAMLAKEHPEGHSFAYKLRVRGLRVRELNRTATNWVWRAEDGEWFVSFGLIVSSEDEPALLGLWSDTMTNHWLVGRSVYATQDLDLTPADVVALVNEATNRRRLQLAKAHALQAMTAQLDPKSRRERIPQDVKVLVWQRDAGRCVQCDSKTDLEFDHIIPLAMGGSNTARNLQLLCANCNRRKGSTLG